MNFGNRYLGGIRVKKLGIITISVAIIVNVVGANVMAKDELKEYSLYGYGQWKGYESNNKKEIVNNGRVNPVLPETDTEISSGNGKVCKKQAEAKAPEQTKVPEQIIDYSTKKSEKSFTCNAFNHPVWGQVPGEACMPIPAHPYGYTPPVFGQPSDNTYGSKPDSAQLKPDISSNGDSLKKQTPDNTSKPEFHPPSYGYDSTPRWHNHNNIPESKKEVSSKEDFQKQQTSDNKDQPQFHIPSSGYNSTPWWQTACNLNKNNFDGDKQFPVEQQISEIDTAFLEDSKSSSKLTLINTELEKSRQELVVIRNDAKRQISNDLKETRKEMLTIFNNNKIDKKDKKLKINELKSDFKLKVKNINEDAAIKVKDVIEKQDSKIHSILD